MGLVYESGRCFFFPPARVLLQDEFKGGPWGARQSWLQECDVSARAQREVVSAAQLTFSFSFSPAPQPITPPPRLVSIVRNCSRLGLIASFHFKGASGWRQTEETVLTFLLTSGILCASCVLSLPFIRL